MSDPDNLFNPITRRLKRRAPGWLSPTLSFVILALVVFAGVLAWTPRQSYAQQAPATTSTPTGKPTSTPTGTLEVALAADDPVDTATPAVKPTRSPTPIPLEWQTNAKETDGVILGAIVLVLIVIGGTLHAIRSNGQ